MVVIVQGPSGKEEKAAVRHIDEFTIHRFRGLQDLNSNCQCGFHH
ncbi:MAG TPA: hypothetical protein VGT82_04535 [Ktedonobacteraceae bacterium]|nr:hypothetical protein [Ktedonobacteraceae bacterium]